MKDYGLRVHEGFDQEDFAKHALETCRRCGAQKWVVMYKTKINGAHAFNMHCAKCGEKKKELPHAVKADGLGETELYFGKHKGKKIKDVPVDYLHWCAMNLDAKLATKIRSYLTDIKR